MTNLNDQLKASHAELDRQESLDYWREILQGAIEDEQSSWKFYADMIGAYNQARDRWAADWDKMRELEKKVQEMESQR